MTQDKLPQATTQFDSLEILFLTSDQTNTETLFWKYPKLLPVLVCVAVKRSFYQGSLKTPEHFVDEVNCRDSFSFAMSKCPDIGCHTRIRHHFLRSSVRLISYMALRGNSER